MIERVRAASIRALFDQMRTTALGVVFILGYMIAATAPFNHWMTIAAWVAVVLAFQLLREILRRRFARANPADDRLEQWARLFVIHQAFAAVAWASSMFLFAYPEQPITVALTVCCLYSVAAGAVAAQAYTPVSFYALVSGLFSIAFARLAATGEYAYVVLGVASVLFGVAVVGYCKMQAAIVAETFRIRFENAALLEALSTQTAAAERARGQAEQANIAKSQFLAAASHDLRQPLYALSLFSASLEELRLDEESRLVMRRIQESITVMESLFDGLLDISRLEAGVVVPQLRPVSVDDLFDLISQVFWPIASEQRVDLRLRSDGEWISSDFALAEQVLSNLVSNALRATSAGGAVLVAARRRGDGVRIEVWDTGRGIGDDDLRRIFEEFVQLANPERDRRKGLGLGLSIAQRAITLVGGTITVASRLGRGSRFAFKQPAIERPPVQPTQSLIADALTDAKSEMPRLLVVEDDLDIRTAFASLLRKWNVTADLETTAEAALALVEQGRRYDLLLTDYRLPGTCNGLQLVTALRATHPHPQPRCLLLTGDLDPVVMARANDLGVEVILKPVATTLLRTLVTGRPTSSPAIENPGLRSFTSTAESRTSSAARRG